MVREVGSLWKFRGRTGCLYLICPVKVLPGAKLSWTHAPQQAIMTGQLFSAILIQPVTRVWSLLNLLTAETVGESDCQPNTQFGKFNTRRRRAAIFRKLVKSTFQSDRFLTC